MSENLKKLPLKDIRSLWATKWNLDHNTRIGRAMLEKSLLYKEHGLAPTHEIELKKLTKQYKRNSKCFDETYALKPGTKLVRNWKGKQHSVTVKTDGFEYKDAIYPNLSEAGVRKIIMGSFDTLMSL